jgi:hypothetical protein
MVKIIEFLYGIVKNYIMTQANATGNNAFITKFEIAFRIIEETWNQIKAIKQNLK